MRGAELHPARPGVEHRPGLRGHVLGCAGEGEQVEQVGGESYTLTAGESVTFDSRLAHLYRNASGERAHLIIAVTPPTPDRPPWTCHGIDATAPPT
ncbi:cupin domain-containing protein [Micromonospora taraxaci]|uniref:cupin domain-containing protein n=1 Tax=Micromonospora taraxaci TaxID=1316803 RepID=UPI0033DE0BC1